MIAVLVATALCITGPILTAPAHATPIRGNQSSIRANECARTGGHVVRKSGQRVCMRSRRYPNNTPVKN
ncbi:hypothetical protein IU500_08440 [Nocardia terpenica]|uniref:hypothetical protein n=1 Tax=Nocardia terpenica TaxID=455432 RepID=UPI001895931C|nr:hypothetical protein [Nocardia terpenica]MBF6060805.1 hypothetical protein [Nocardia terpenica]MBF6104065.1 hypothetical protein [Nocardia terpenica]MBF6111561.1 hypothetical protein [Nocardia terpenica]MBF6118286.1 hypothetical protein [Nocardia terpenica]MBF6156089.1 hypothetical protein [Nocardia terpenica]